MSSGITKTLSGEDQITAGRGIKAFCVFHQASQSGHIKLYSQMAKDYPEEAGVDTLIWGPLYAWHLSVCCINSRNIDRRYPKSSKLEIESVFQKFYHRKVSKAAFGRAVLNQNSSE